VILSGEHDLDRLDLPGQIIAVALALRHVPTLDRVSRMLEFDEYIAAV
jgi:hypothetical protein